MRKWLARLSFSLVIVAAVLAYEGYHTHYGNRPTRPRWAAYAFVAGAALCFGVGLSGVRDRHRLLDQARRGDSDDVGDRRDNS